MFGAQFARAHFRRGGVRCARGESGAARGDFVEMVQALRGIAGAAHALAELRAIERAASELADAAKDFGLIDKVIEKRLEDAAPKP